MWQALQQSWAIARRRMPQARLHRSILSLGMLGALAILLSVLLAWQLPYGSQLLLEPDEIAPFTVMAPQRLNFESSLLTERAQERAAQQVLDQYDVEETAIRRQQVSLARELLAQISAIRQQTDVTLARQTAELIALTPLGVDATTAVQILSLSDEQWQQTAREVPVALDRAMRVEIRESTVGQARRNVPSLLSSTLDDDSSDVTIQLVRNLILPNSFYNAAESEQLREVARAAVQPQFVTLIEGETIIRSGDRATAEQVEKLAALTLLHTEWNPWTAVRSILLTLLLLTVGVATLTRVQRTLLTHLNEQAILLAITALWLLAAKTLMVNHPWLPFLFPLPSYAMLTAIFCTPRVAQVLLPLFAAVLLYLLPANPAMLLYQLVGALSAVWIVGRAERLDSFFWAGLVVCLSNLTVMFVMFAPFEGYSSTMFFELVLVVTANGLLNAAIALIGYFLLGNFFGVITPLQLTELSRPTHPLLRQVLLKASGTYHHTILVSNLAERAAAVVGADALLVRVGAYYHDIGKTVRPYFFAENILDGSSPHEKLDPWTSAQIIISHVKDGIDLAQKYNLPERIQDFIREHHGRSLVKYFYLLAQQLQNGAKNVDEAAFRYPGPNPRSRETAILMLADTCEAAVRAMRPSTREELEKLVHRLVDERIANGDLDDSDLTFKDMQKVKEVFLQVLQGIHHPRIRYPETAEYPERPPASPPASPPTLPAQRPRQEIGGLEKIVSPPVTPSAALEG